ncbi:MAG: repressor LexA, partial [Treponemataceae bacterium]|nr:repressor LexA [Treponemataceae bacterium]
MKEITQVQKNVLDYISKFIDENSYPPTVREISEHFGKSIRAVQDNMT